MGFFTSGIFWFIEGILFVSILIGLRSWVEDRGYYVPWWKWILLIIWIFFFGFTVAFIGTNIGENEITAAFRGGILFSLLAIISAVGLIRILALPRRISSETK